MKSIFTKDAIDTLSNINNPSLEQNDRLRVLNARDGHYSDDLEYPRLIAQGEIWESYINTSRQCGLFEGKEGIDLTKKLTGKSDKNFYSAMGECMACWFFKELLNLDVKPRPPGRKGKLLDMAVRSGDRNLMVEVKAPFMKREEGTICYWENDKSLRKNLEKATDKFTREAINILFLAPRLLSHVTRTMLITAFHVVPKAVILRNNLTGEEIEPARMGLFPEGLLLNTKFNPEGVPYHKRVSVVVCVEERMEGHFSDPDSVCFDHDVYIIHNPCALNPAPSDIWMDYPQLQEGEDGLISWSDGYMIEV